MGNSISFFTWNRIPGMLFYWLLLRTGISKTFLLRYDGTLRHLHEIRKRFELSSSVFSAFIGVEGTPVRLRKNSSDLAVFYQVFIEEEYRRSIEIIKERVEIPSGPVIWDAGANIGMASLYFKQHFPDARLLAMEPFAENRAMIPAEIPSLSCALWSRNANLRTDMGFRDGQEWSVRVTETPDGNIPGRSLPSLTEEFGDKIDILKIDIEGSEYEVFLHTEDIEIVLRNIRALVMEIHEDAGDAAALKTVFLQNNFECKELGELTLFLNRSFLKK